MNDEMTWLPHSPHRRPHWRWIRAVRLAAGQSKPDHRIDDSWVLTARRAFENTADVDDETKAVLQAKDLWKEAAPARRAELEARILAGEPAGDVAAKCGTALAVVTAYIEVFFDVRGRLAAADWILTYAIGYRYGSGFADPYSPTSTWKYVAFFGGPLALDTAIAVTSGRPLPPGLVPDGRRHHFEEAQLRLLVKLTLASFVATSPAELAPLVAARDRMNEPGSGDAKNTPLLSIMGKFLAASEATGPRGRASKEQPAAPIDATFGGVEKSGEARISGKTLQGGNDVAFDGKIDSAMREQDAKQRRAVGGTEAAQKRPSIEL